MNLVSIVILNWNGKAFLEKFLPVLVTHSKMEGAEIVVADNGSSDDSLPFMEKEYPQIRLIRLDKNYGFTGGYNRALSQLDSKYFLLLNSDIEVTANWLEPLVSHMEAHPSCAACTPKIKDYKNKSYFEYAGAAGGYIDKYGYPFCRGRIFDALEEDKGQFDQKSDIFWGSGACLLLRAEPYRAVGELDEQFFAHMEEIDLCWRLKRVGWVVNFIPDSTVYHVGGGTLARGNPRKTYLNFRNNLLLLHKNLPKGKKRRSILFFRMIFDGISALRFLLGGSLKDFFAVIRAHRDYYGMKKNYAGTEIENKSGDNAVIVSGIYPGSIVSDFFLKGRRKFEAIKWEDQ
jgi:GT2 family glycosyltransferase